MAILGNRLRFNRLRRMAFFLVGLLGVLALACSSMLADQSATATHAWGSGTTVSSVLSRAGYEAASSHLEPNFYQ